MKVHFYVYPMFRSYCGIDVNGLVTQSEKQVTCKNCKKVLRAMRRVI